MYYGEGDGAFGPNDSEIDNFDSFYTIYIYIYIYIFICQEVYFEYGAATNLVYTKNRLISCPNRFFFLFFSFLIHKDGNFSLMHDASIFYPDNR